MAESNEVVAYLRAEVTGFTSAMANAAGAIKGIGKQIEEDAARFGPTLAAAFSIDKIKDFVIEGIKDFAQYERALDVLGAKVTASGGNWSATKKQVADYAQQIQETTRFSDDQVVRSLDVLMLRVNNLSDAYRLNERAMNFSVLTGNSLEESATILGLAYEGNTRGLAQLSRSLGVTGAEAKNAQYLFDLLEQRSKDLARTESGLATQLDIAGNAVKDLQKQIGEGMAPAIGPAAEAVSWLVMQWQNFASVISFVILEIFDFAKAGVMLTATIAQIDPLHPIESFKRMGGVFKTMATDMKNDALGLASAWQSGEARNTGATIKGMKDRIIVHQKEKEALEAWEKKNAETWKNIQAFANTAANGIAQGFSTATEGLIKGTLSVKQAFAELGKSIAKSLINAFGDALIQLGAKYYAEALGALISVVGAPASPGLFAAASFEIAAGGTIKGVAAAMAEGGIVTKPTHIMAGEKGPEAIIPLDKAGGMGNVSMGQVHLNFPNMRNESDIKNPARFGNTVQAELARNIQLLNQRKGIKI